MGRLLSTTIMIILAAVICFPTLIGAQTDIGYTDDGLKITNHKQWIKIGGVVMWDADAASGVFWNSESDNDNWHTASELRRFRLSIKTRMSDNWMAKIQVDYDNDDRSVGIKDAFVEYCLCETASLIVGKDKEPFGLENLSSSKNLYFKERSLVSSALGPGRNIGIALTGDRKNFFWQAGVYQADPTEDEDYNYAITGRFALVPLETKTGFLHLGVSGSYRKFDGEKFKIDEPALVHTADLNVFSDKIDTEDIMLYGIEAAFGYGPFAFAGEYIAADVNAIVKTEDATFSGYYLSAGWILTGESRSLKNGTWKRVKPESKYGAVELTTRYGRLDASNNHEGTEAEACTLGINWYVNSHITLMTDYIYLWLTDEETAGETTADAVSFRLQFIF